MTNKKNPRVESGTEHWLRIPVAVDLVILTIRHNALCALVVRRGIAPFKGRLALPGGFVRARESLEAAAARELAEETGLHVDQVGHIEQLATFGAPARDPRERVLSVAYLAFVPDLPAPQPGGDAFEARIETVASLFDGTAGVLAFDHAEILRAGVERARAKLEYTALATAFCAEQFTIQALRQVYEAVWGVALDPANFHRKVTKTPDFVIATDATQRGESGRPAQLYRAGQARILYPPILRNAG